MTGQSIPKIFIWKALSLAGEKKETVHSKMANKIMTTNIQNEKQCCDRAEGAQNNSSRCNGNTIIQSPCVLTPPIVITAFGTTSHARKTYDYIDQQFRKRFPGHELCWAFSSRVVKDHVRKNSRNEIHSPVEVLETLHTKGHSWAVVQSLHLIPGHEFYRLVNDVNALPIRTSIGLPLLTSYRDYCSTARAMELNHFPADPEEVVLLVGHGTDHPAWSAYPALESILRQIYGPRIFMGLIEGDIPQSVLIESMLNFRAKKVRLIPFTLVAGLHFQEDITGGPDSWKSILENVGLAVTVETKGIGYRQPIVEIFADHIADALYTIPVSSG